MKKSYIYLFLILAGLAILWLSSFNESVLKICEKRFKIENLQYYCSGGRVIKKDLWYPTYFQCKIAEGKYDELILYLKSSPYKNIQHGSVSYDPIYVGGDSEDDWYYTQREDLGKNHISLAFSKKEGVLYLIDF